MRPVIALVFFCSLVFCQTGSATSLYIADDSGSILSYKQGVGVSVFIKNAGHPTDIHFNPSGELTYWDYADKTLYRVTHDLQVEPYFSLPGSVISGYDFDEAGNIYFSDIDRRVLSKYDQAGTLIWEVHDVKIGAGVAVGTNKLVFVGGPGDHLIHVFDQSGVAQSFALSGEDDSNPVPSYIGPDNSVYGLSASDGKVFLWSGWDGQVYTTFDVLVDPVYWPGDVAIDHKGMVYVPSTFGVPGISIFGKDGGEIGSITSNLMTSPNSIEFGPNYPHSYGPIPEPTTLLLFGAGLAGLAAAGRRRQG